MVSHRSACPGTTWADESLSQAEMRDGSSIYPTKTTQHSSLICADFLGAGTAKQVALHSHAGLIKMLHGKCFCAMQVPVLAFHHSPEIYRNPEAYVPERWMEGTPEYAQDSQVQGKWMPFGDGTRVCVGQRLALMEAKVALAHVFRRCGFFRVCAPRFD